MNNEKTCSHNHMIETDDDEYAWKCADCGHVFGEVYCHPCSVSGGAEMPIHHAPPVCKSK